MPERLSHDRLLTLGLVAVLLLVGVVSFQRAADGKFDFEHFYRDARYVWEHRALNPDLDNPNPELRRRLPFYLPVVPLLLAPLAALGRVAAAVVWAAAQVATLGYSLSVLRKWGTEGARSAEPERIANSRAGNIGRPDQDVRRRRWTMLALALAVAVPALAEAAKFNQLSFVVLALVLAGTSALERERSKTAGVLLALAAVLKLLPALFLPWLLLKRRFAAAGTLVLAAAAVALLPCLVVFGPQRTLEYHQHWWHYNVGGDAVRGLVNPALREHFIDHRNQSIAQVLARLTWAKHPYRVPWQPVQLEPAAALRLAYGVTAVLLLALLAATHRPWRRLATRDRRAEVASYALAMLVLAPLVRTYYLVWALPALVALARSAGSAETGRARQLGWWGLAVWLAGMLAWISETARLYGAHLILLVVVGVLLLRTVSRQDSPSSAGQNGST